MRQDKTYKKVSYGVLGEGIIKRCYRCKKNFRVYSQDHAYKESAKGKRILFCSWSCLCAYRRVHEKKKEVQYDDD